MTIHDIQIHKSTFNGELVCSATIISKDWKYCNNVVYWSEDNRWASDYNNLSDNQKKMCRREWNKLAKSMDVKLKISFFPPQKISLGGNYNVRPNREETA